MNTSMRAAATLRQSSADDVPVLRTSTTVDHDLAVLRQVISDLNWTFEAIAAAMGRGESYKTHVSRVVSGERPMSLEFIKALPDDIEVEWHARLAAAGGRVVVTPASDDSAVQHFVGGLLTLLRQGQPPLPAKASAMAKVEPARARRTA